MTPPDEAAASDRAALDAVVPEMLEAGFSARAIARELGVERGRVARAIKRFQKRTGVAARSKPHADAGETEPIPTGTNIGDLLSEIDKAIDSALKVGDSQSVGRWTRARAALLQGAAEARKQAASIPKPAENKEDWSRLDDREAATLIALVHKLNGAAITSADERALRMFDAADR
jgi:hypothetical protein